MSLDPYAMLRFLDEAGLTVYQHRLMTHYWRVGESWESMRTIAERCNMSLGKVSEARQWLLDNGYIEWKPSKSGKMAIVVNVHKVNSGNETVHDMNAGVHVVNKSVHDMNAILNNKVNNNTKRESAGADYWQLPESLKVSKPFIQAWHDWLVYTDERKLAFTPRQARLVLRKLAGWGAERSVAAIQASITNGWKNIYEPRTSAANGNGSGGWSAALACIQRGKWTFSRDGPETRALNAIGGWAKVSSCTERELDFLGKRYEEALGDAERQRA